MCKETVALVAVLIGSLLAGCAQLPTSPASVQAEPRGTEYPWMSMERWYRMHAEDVGIAAQGNADLLFVGNSITEGWPEALMQQYFGQYQPANFGIGGDRTENLLWRLRNGSVGQLQPKVVSLLIGVNNFGLRGDSPGDVVAGVTAVVQELQKHFPDASIILHGIFPYKQFADSPEREWVQQVNHEIARLSDHPQVTWLDIGGQLTQPDGNISPEIMPDFLHLSEQGYRIWGNALAPVVHRLMREE